MVSFLVAPLGRWPSAMSFDGGNCSGVSLDGGAGTLQPANSITIEMWAQSNSDSSGILYRDRYFGLQLEPTGFGIYLNGGSSGPSPESANPLRDGLWHYLVGTYNGSDAALYVDGASVATVPGSGPIFWDGGQIAIGRDGDACDGVISSFKGNIAMAAVYANALSPSQIQAHFRASGRSLPTVPQTTGGGIPGDNHTSCSGCPVNTATGEFHQTFTDLSVPGRGVPLGFTRTYSTNLAAHNSPFGYGWADSYGMTLSKNTVTGDVTVNQANGSAVTFIPAGGGPSAAHRTTSPP